jgi:curved DNA-binding protein CbpA
MSDARFREVLGVEPGASREEIRRCWRRRVMENHPDRFPSDRKPVQELRVIALNEAYASLMALARDSRIAATASAGRMTARSAAAATGAARQPPPQAGTVGPHRDPAYAYYKQGFLNFSLAVHGIAEMDARVAASRQPSYTPRYEAARDVAGSLGLLAEAHRYFARVVERHPDSVWAADATVKLRRIERFTRLYRTILTNIGAARA